MFFQLLFIHLFRPFLKYNQATSPLPAHVSPRKLCTHAAAMISKLLRLYKRTHGLRQICNIAVYIAHSACTIHLLNLPEKNAKRDIIHGVKHLEEIAESWLCARRTLGILSILANRWKIEMPEEAATILARTDAKFGLFHFDDQYSTKSETGSPQRTQRISSPVHASGGMDYPGSNGVFSGGIPSTKPTSTSTAQQSSATSSLAPQSTAEVQRLSRQHRYDMSQAQEELWNRDLASRGSAAAAQMSPSTLFGGVDALVQESEGWWVKDQAALASGFGNWTGMEPDMSLLGNATSGSGYMVNGVNSYNLNDGDMYA